MRFPILPMLAVLGLAWAGTAAAQTPVVTPQGDPSVDSDTIYRLVVDPADHPNEQIVLLLDDGVVRYEGDGTGTTTYRYVAQVLKQDAVDSWAEHTFSYDPEHERFSLNWARVLDAHGNVLSAEPLHVQETTVPAPEGAPVFTDQKQIRVSLAGVAPNTIVDYSYTVERFEAELPGDFFGSWFFNPGSTIRRSRLVLDLPASLDAPIHAVDVAVEPRVVRRDGRLIREWSLQDVAYYEAEPFMPDSNGVTQYLRYSGALEWSDIGAWYRELADGRYAMTPELEAQLATIVRGSTTLTDSLRAVHRYVAQDVRYVSLSLGIGGYQPRMPAEVLRTLSGDCKDKATLFIAFARALGVDAYPVLATTGRVDPLLPSLQQFNHAIARVELPEGPLYVDLTASLVPWGELPGVLHNEHGLVVFDDAPAQLVRFDDPPATASHRVMRVAGELATDGGFTGVYEESGTGLMQYSLRQPFYQELTAEQRDRLVNAIANGLFNGARGDSLVAFDGRDLTATPVVAVRIRAPRAATSTPDGGRIFSLPFGTMGNQQLLEYLESRTERRTPFHIGAISGDNRITYELDLALPDGWTAVLPEAVEAKSRFGTYRSTYELDGNMLRVRRDYLGERGVAPAGALQELIEWLQGMTGDDVRYLVLHPKRT